MTMAGGLLMRTAWIVGGVHDCGRRAPLRAACTIVGGVHDCGRRARLWTACCDVSFYGPACTMVGGVHIRRPLGGVARTEHRILLNLCIWRLS